MIAATVKDMKKLLEGAHDDDVMIFSIFDEKLPDAVKYSSDIADSTTLQAVKKFGQETSDGTRNVFRISLVLDLDPKD